MRDFLFKAFFRVHAGGDWYKILTIGQKQYGPHKGHNTSKDFLFLAFRVECFLF